MATDLKRFTISVTSELQKKLDKVKQERFYKATQNDMIRELINRGLEALEKESNCI